MVCFVGLHLMTIKIKASSLHLQCAGRGPKFAADVLSVAKKNGDALEIESADWERLTVLHSQIRKPFGLGDAVASVAQPIAGILDSVLGTHIKGCAGCAQRRETLNKLVPDLKALVDTSPSHATPAPRRSPIDQQKT